MLEPAKVPIAKSEPKRTYIVLTFTVIGFILACLFSLFKGIDWSSIEF
jgi:LPS O-antigen subunit length determinant protein (WzzB/FepE family)